MRALLRFVLHMVCWMQSAVSTSAWAQKEPDPFHPDSLRATVSALSHDSMAGRWSGTQEAHRAAQYIAKRFVSAGLRRFINQRFLWYFEHTNGLRAANVFAVVPGRSKAGEWILISAHYDHIGTLETAASINAGFSSGGKDKIFNGANDNASGVAGLLALAQAAARDTTIERTVIFAAFTGEELGLLGSRAAADSLDVRRIVAHINLEMLGRPHTLPGGRPFISGSSRSTLLQILNETLAAADTSAAVRDFFQKDRFEQDQIFYRSDNYPFYQAGVVGAHTICGTSPVDVFYHTPDDEIETLDFEAMSVGLRNLYSAAGALFRGTATPIKPPRRRARN